MREIASEGGHARFSSCNATLVAATFCAMAATPELEKEPSLRQRLQRRRGNRSLRGLARARRQRYLLGRA
ncbi:MAG: hypothetical protein R3F19_15060 [Verrucomicrobiales bacterium]